MCDIAYSAILAAIGAMLLAYSMYLSRKTVPLIEWAYLRKPWRALFLLLLLAFAGYVIRLRAIVAGAPDLLLDSILFFWAVFAMIALRAGYRLVDGLKTTEVKLNISRHELESDQTSIETLKNEFESKNEELTKLLAEVYALRNSMEKNRAGKSAAENKRMNNILAELKNELDANKKLRG